MNAKEGRARLLGQMGRTEALEKGFMENGLGFHSRGGARGLQGLVHLSQVSGWKPLGEGRERRSQAGW